MFIFIDFASILDSPPVTYTPGLPRTRIHVRNGNVDCGVVTVTLPLVMDGLQQMCTILSVIEAVEKKLALTVAGM